MALIDSMRAKRLSQIPLPVPRRPENDKMSRVMGMSGQIAAGQLLLPADANWLGTFRTELLGFRACGTMIRSTRFRS